MSLPTTKIRPTYNQIVVMRDEPPTRIGSIIVPDTVREAMRKKGTQGTVLRVGPGRYRRARLPHKVKHGQCVRCGAVDTAQEPEALCPRLVDTNERVPLDVRPGDRVWFHHEAGTTPQGHQIDLEEGGRQLTVMWDDEVMAYEGGVRDELELSEAMGAPGAQEALASALSS